MKRELSPSNILIPPRTMKDNNNKNNTMGNLINKDTISQQEVVRNRMKKDNHEKGDQMKELDYKSLITHQKSVREKIITTEKQQDYIQEKLPIYTKVFKEGNITPETYVSFMQIIK